MPSRDTLQIARLEAAITRRHGRLGQRARHLRGRLLDAAGWPVLLTGSVLLGFSLGQPACTAGWRCWAPPLARLLWSLARALPGAASRPPP